VTLPPVAELEREATELLRRWRVLDTKIRVHWNDRLTTTAGRAFVKLGSVELNPTLLQRAPDQLRVVLTHEVAHVAAARLFGQNVAAHGRHWRALMALAGLPPDITHKIPLRNLPRRRARYFYLRICDACGDRLIAATVRYGRCHGCEARDDFLVMKAPATAAGRRALQKLSLTDVRTRCIMARP
jgi:predicted SprT family Zn-dependent metalloprotease